LAALMTILEDTEGKAIVWARFVKDLDLIAEKLGKSAIRYRGDVGDVQRFQEDERIRYFIANPATAGLGLTLTAAQTVVYYSNDFDLEHRLQSEDRTHRIGTTGSVTYIDIDATGTVDSKIINSLREKKLISDAVLQDPAGFFMEYGDE
jgi:SNF2 family DNA or RNA helicase